MNDELPDAQRAILDAAEKLFATHGFAATTVKAIGQEAGVNPALLYYYYSDKTALYRAVLDRRVAPFARGMMSQLSADLAPLDAISLIARGQVAFLTSAPLLPRLIARELADHAAAHATPVIRENLIGLFRRVTALIAAGQADGSIRQDLDPRFAAISTISQVVWFFVAQPMVLELLQQPGGISAAEVDRFAAHVVSFTRAALAPSPSTASK
jgi:TetR/AcrR family transcriptional regulator